MGLSSILGGVVKLGLAFAVIVAVVGVGGVIGICSATEMTCVSDPGPIETPTPDGATTSEASSTPSEASTSDGDETGTEASPGTEAAGGTTRTETPDPEQARIEGPDPPAYPPRTDKQWDGTLEFDGDPGETIAEGDRWRVSSEDVERFLAEDVNDYREENGKSRLEYSHALASVSREHSEDMHDRDYFAHENPDGERAWDRWGHGHCREWYGENLFRSWANAPLEGADEPLRTADGLAQRTLRGWKNSPPHDEAMLEDSWDAVGYGVYLVYSDDDDGSYEMYVTMNMCTYNENER
jgi:uncharacterized protein YkwD